MKMISVQQPAASHIITRALWSLAVLFWFGACVFQHAAFLAELLFCGLPGLSVSTSLACQVVSGRFTLTVLFSSDNLPLCIVCSLLRSSSELCVFIYVRSFIGPGWVMVVPLCRSLPHAPTRQLHGINHKSTFIWFILGMLVMSARTLMWSLLKRAPPLHLWLYICAEMSSVCRFYIVKHNQHQIKRPLKPCLWGAVFHSQFYQQSLCPISSSGWQLIKQQPWAPTLLFSAHIPMCVSVYALYAQLAWNSC